MTAATPTPRVPGGPGGEPHVLLGRRGLRFFVVARAIVVGVCRLLWRVHVRGAERVPPAGGYVLAPTHRSLLDIPFTATVTRRRIHYMGKRDLWGIGLLGRLWDSLGAFPVDRSSSRPALRAAKAVLDAGEPLVVFPEGTRNHGPQLGELFHGTAWMAARSGVPIVPIGIGGSEALMPPGRTLPRLGRVAVVVGEPIPPAAPDDRAAVAAVTALLRDELQRAFDAANAIAAGGGPQPAGR